MENQTRIRKYLGRETCLSFCQCVSVKLKATSRSTVSFSLIPTFPTSLLSTETGSLSKQGEVLQLYVASLRRFLFPVSLDSQTGEAVCERVML